MSITTPPNNKHKYLYLSAIIILKPKPPAMDSSSKSDSTLHEKLQLLMQENEQLRKENRSLKRQLGIDVDTGAEGLIKKKYDTISFNKNSSPEEKVKLFQSLFKGRKEVYAQRWENQKGKSGYSPVCLNEWKPGVCAKPKIKCSACPSQNFQPLDEKAMEAHLRGKRTAGIYPLLPDDSCHFLAIDFDKADWQKDVLAIVGNCKNHNIPIAIERSRSGNGAHLWFFFEEKTEAATARKFGSALLTTAMNQRHEISFKSYDRLFPNQDNMPNGGFGNLIALPLQQEARQNNNSVFIDENLQPYPDQWLFLNTIKRLSKDKLIDLVKNLNGGNELGVLKEDKEEPKPWERKPGKVILSKEDFPKEITIFISGLIYILKSGISQLGMNALKRLAAFKNPEFYKAQAMRLPVYNLPRIISCVEETKDYLCLPRGCKEDMIQLLEEYQVEVHFSDQRNTGIKIKVDFRGKLRPDQQQAVNNLLKYEEGIISAPPAFGKTVMAANMIAQKKRNTLILVHRKQLLSQWADRLESFLDLNNNAIGQLGGGKNALTGKIDIAIMQSLNREGEVKELVRDYGMVLIDECHHIPAFSFEKILKKVTAKYVYGLTATPYRKDGHHPIVFMCCGPVRYKVDAGQQASLRPFEHFVIPRFTDFLVTQNPFTKGTKDWTIQELYSRIANDEMRNQFIVDDVTRNYKKGRNALILTERTAHVEILKEKLRREIPNIIALTGGHTTKESQKLFDQINQIPEGEPISLVATGKYIGEGFDEARLDTLFLAMPISWKGTLQQYTGRLHRLHHDKKEVQVYDYVDIHVKMLEKMYTKRLNGYATVGYKVKGDGLNNAPADIIFNKDSFLPVYSRDILNAKAEITIVSPFVSESRVEKMLPLLSEALVNDVKITIVTRPAEDFKNKDISTVNFEQLSKSGIQLVFQSGIHQKFAIIDQRVSWYGSINLLSYGSSQESMMRIESGHIANELIRSMDL